MNLYLHVIIKIKMTSLQSSFSITISQTEITRANIHDKFFDYVDFDEDEVSSDDPFYKVVISCKEKNRNFVGYYCYTRYEDGNIWENDDEPPIFSIGQQMVYDIKKSSSDEDDELIKLISQGFLILQTSNTSGIVTVYNYISDDFFMNDIFINSIGIVAVMTHDIIIKYEKCNTIADCFYVIIANIEDDCDYADNVSIYNVIKHEYIVDSNIIVEYYESIVSDEEFVLTSEVIKNFMNNEL